MEADIVIGYKCIGIKQCITDVQMSQLRIVNK